MPFTVRDLSEDDAAEAAALLNIGAPEPVGVEQMRERLRRSGPGSIVARLGAAVGTGALVGYAHAIREEWMEPGLFWMHVVVAPPMRRRGAGGQLYQALLDFAARYDARTLRGEVRDNAPEDLRFAEARGWRIDRHIFESVLDLARFDETPFRGALDRARASGIRFFTMADVGDTPDARRKLYELQRIVARDIPGGSEAAVWPYETFLERVCEAPTYRPDGRIVAADGVAEGETWVGVASVEPQSGHNSMYNGITGVLPSHRGRGIALALKLLAIRAARRHNAASIRTNNDSENAPMLAINRKLGYASEPGYYRMIAHLDGIADLG